MSYNSEVTTDVFHLLKRFRHDLLNDLQILGGHLQMNKSKQVLTEDIHAMTRRIQQISRLFACGDNQLALTLWALQDLAFDYEVELSVDAPGLAEPAGPEWHQALMQVGSTLIVQAASFGGEPHHLNIELCLPESAAFEVPAAGDQVDIQVPGFSVKVDTRESGLRITVSASPGEE